MDKAYKIVKKLCSNKYVSLFSDRLVKYTIEYKTDKAINGNLICFVFDNIEIANKFFNIMHNSIQESIELWECEGEFVKMPKIFLSRSQQLGLFINYNARFMKKVKLTKRIK